MKYNVLKHPYAFLHAHAYCFSQHTPLLCISAVLLYTFWYSLACSAGGDMLGK